MEQFEPAASVGPQAFEPVVMAKSLGFAPVMLGAMLLSVAIAAEVVPTVVLGKLSDEVSDAAGAVPVPVSDDVCGDPLALSATDSVAEKLAAEAGVKVM
jgi:hypothetical protein